MDICKYYRNYCYRSAEALGLCASEIDIIIALGEDPKCNTVIALSKSVHLSKSVVSKSVDSLKKKGYVSVEENCDDRRYVKILLKDAARPIVDEISTSAERFIKQIGDGIDEEELCLITKFITRIYTNTEKMKKTELTH
jgi:DNA-binding MarR family transcriptional regulator